MKILGLLLLVTAVVAKHELYEGFKSYYLEASDQDQLKIIGQITDRHLVDVIGRPAVGRPGVVLVGPLYQEAFLSDLEENGLTYTVHSDNVKAVLEEEDIKVEASRQASRSRNNGRTMPYDTYAEMEDIDQYLDELAANYPDTVTVFTAANSFEGRPIKGLRISTTNFEDTSKPIIFIDGGIHAREWIAPPPVTYAMHKLVENITESDMINDVDWILIPVANPDGYKYTFTDERFWRKTRSTAHSLGNLCPGVDGNRNYDFFWGTVGSSTLACADTYAGPRAFSEIETQVVRNLLLQYLDRIPLYLTMHSYGSMILYPWGHDGSLPPNVANLHTVGVAMGEAIDQVADPSFPRYIVGNSVVVIGYPASGASEDYAHSIGIPLAYTYELPGLAGGFQGFHLDPIWIPQVSRETWAGIVAGVRRTLQMFREIERTKQ